MTYKCVSRKENRDRCAPQDHNHVTKARNRTGEIWKANPSKVKTDVVLQHSLKEKKRGGAHTPPAKPSVQFIHGLVNSCCQMKAKQRARQDCAGPQAATRPHNWIKMIQYKQGWIPGSSRGF